ncbi:MAG: biopolymer transporter ExbD [Methanobacteriaceae archaeon]
MALDIKKHRDKINRTKPEFNLVPFIDILFTILIFLVVASSFNPAIDTGKPDASDNSGNSEYYIIPVAGLEKVLVNGVDMSQDIRNGAIAVHSKVIDHGEISIKPQEGLIDITTPPGMNPQEAVAIPNPK